MPSLETAVNDARVDRVFALAVDVWQSEGEAQDFLSRAHPMLDDQRPVDVETGAELVFHLLASLKYGSVA